MHPMNTRTPRVSRLRRAVRTLSLVLALAVFASACNEGDPNVFVFAGLQLIARIFLIAEWATSMVIAAEEFPADRRGNAAKHAPTR